MLYLITLKSYFYLASRISNLPITVVIAAFSTVLLPEFFLKNKTSNKFKINIFSDSLFYCFMLMTYICIGLYFNSYLFIDILFGRGEFLENSILQTSKVFKQKLFGVFILSFHLILYTFFISQKENRVILYASLFGLCGSFLLMFISSFYNNFNFFGYNLLDFSILVITDLQLSDGILWLVYNGLIAFFFSLFGATLLLGSLLCIVEIFIPGITKKNPFKNKKKEIKSKNEKIGQHKIYIGGIAKMKRKK